MRVAMICPQAPPVYSGAGGQALALAACLVRRGCSVEILTQNQLLAPRVETIEGVRIVRCPGERVARRLPARLAEILRTVLFTIWLLVRLRRRQHDVYHVHGGYWFALAPALLARLSGVPLVLKVTRLGDDDAETLGGKRIGPVPLGWLASAPMRVASAVIALNPEIARRQRSTFPHVPLVSLPNGVDVARFAATPERRLSGRRRLGIPDQAAVALFVGYVGSRKGISELLDAWGGFVARRPAGGPAPLLLLVGPASGPYRGLSADSTVRAGSEASGRAGVRLLQHLPSESMPELYAAADVFVLPTRAEGMPNSLLEALAAGLPTIASRVPGVTEILEEEDGSVLIDPPSPANIEQALVDLLERRRGRPEAARASRAPSRFALESVADAYVDLYRVLRGSSRVGRSGAVARHIEALEQRG